MKKLLFILSAVIVLTSCSKKDEDPQPIDDGGLTTYQPKLIFKLYFDSTLTRLDNFGNPATIPLGNSAQSPRFNHMSAHYIELAQDSFTQLGNGFIAYHGQETSAGGSNAVNFDQAIVKQHGETFYSMPLSSVSPGTYKWLRVSLTYQNYDIDFKAAGNMYVGTLASFVGFNNYITSYTINTQSVTVNANKLQGYWGFETIIFSTPYVYEGQAPGTTVPNPLSSTSPVPAGSCVVTGDFPTALTITGSETSDVIVNINLSTNNSFEWKDLNQDGIYEPSDGVNPGDTVVDMGLRGLFPTWQ